MREPDFHSLRERLLRGGVAPKHVRRTIAELRDHHTDLFSEAFSGGCSFENAEREASIRLGDEDSLAAEILARPELRSWTHRWPWIAYCVTPTFLLGFAFVALPLLLGSSDAVRTDQGTFSDRWGSPAAVWSVSGVIRLFYSFGLPVLLAGACCFVAGQRRVAPRWPLIGVIIASIVGGAIQFNAVWPYGPELAGALSVTISVPPFPGSRGTVLRAAATCALTLGPYLWWRACHHRSQPASRH
jgi:hypothetical protein